MGEKPVPMEWMEIVSCRTPWSNEESQFHINMLELLAVEYAIKAFLKTTEVSAVQILSDSRTVVAYINWMGCTRSQQLTDLTKKI